MVVEISACDIFGVLARAIGRRHFLGQRHLVFGKAPELLETERQGVEIGALNLGGMGSEGLGEVSSFAGSE